MALNFYTQGTDDEKDPDFDADDINNTRPDIDKNESMKRAIQEYREESTGLVAFYSGKGILMNIDA